MPFKLRRWRRFRFFPGFILVLFLVVVEAASGEFPQGPPLETTETAALLTPGVEDTAVASACSAGGGVHVAQLTPPIEAPPENNDAGCDDPMYSVMVQRFRREGRAEVLILRSKDRHIQQFDMQKVSNAQLSVFEGQKLLRIVNPHDMSPYFYAILSEPVSGGPRHFEIRVYCKASLAIVSEHAVWSDYPPDVWAEFELTDWSGFAIKTGPDRAAAWLREPNTWYDVTMEAAVATKQTGPEEEIVALALAHCGQGTRLTLLTTRGRLSFHILETGAVQSANLGRQVRQETETRVDLIDRNDDIYVLTPVFGMIVPSPRPGLAGKATVIVPYDFSKEGRTYAWHDYFSGPEGRNLGVLVASAAQTPEGENFSATVYRLGEDRALVSSREIPLTSLGAVEGFRTSDLRIFIRAQNESFTILNACLVFNVRQGDTGRSSARELTFRRNPVTTEWMMDSGNRTDREQAIDVDKLLVLGETRAERVFYYPLGEGTADQERFVCTMVR